MPAGFDHNLNLPTGRLILGGLFLCARVGTRRRQPNAVRIPESLP